MNKVKIIGLAMLSAASCVNAQEANICSSLSLSDATIAQYAKGLCAAGASMQNALASQAQSDQVENPNSALSKLTLGSTVAPSVVYATPSAAAPMPSPQINSTPPAAVPSAPAQSSPNHGGLYSYS